MALFIFKVAFDKTIVKKLIKSWFPGLSIIKPWRPKYSMEMCNDLKTYFSNPLAISVLTDGMNH